MTGGITNILYLIKGIPSIPRVLLRISGDNTEQIIDREQELRTLVSLSNVGVAPKLYGRFNNGLFYEYVYGKAITPQQMKDPLISTLIAEHIAYFHAKASVTGIPKTPILFDTITKWLDVAESNQLPEISQALSEINFSLSKSKQVVGKLRGKLENSIYICYCHNDLLSGNIIFDESASNGPTVHFIDFEYGGYNYRGFDIANHFCEMMGFDLDLNEYPSEEFQITWLSTYLKSFLLHSKEQIPQDFSARVSEVQEIVGRFAVIAHLFWGIWALIQHQFSTNKEFNYLEYAKQRLSIYLTLEKKE